MTKAGRKLEKTWTIGEFPGNLSKMMEKLVNLQDQHQSCQIVRFMSLNPKLEMFHDIFTPLRVGGRPHRKFFGSVLVKILNMLQNNVCSVFLLFSFNTHVFYTFLGIKSVQNTGSYSVVSIFSSKTT